jgi:FMN phosphatase YigB (HAD superfamily)
MAEHQSSRRPYRKLWATLQKESVRSITVDIFDTLVLRDFSSEEERFLEIARRWLPTMRAAINSSITDWEIFSFRDYARSLMHKEFAWARATGINALPNTEFEPRLSEWVETLILELADKYERLLSSDEVADLVTQLMAEEIAFESTVVRPNRLLLRLLAGFQRDFGVKIYLVSDMYLSGSQLEEVLQRVGVPLFDGVVSSSDLGVSKRSGRLFDVLESGHWVSFTNPLNIHVGDRLLNDFISPLSRGSRAILLRSAHHQIQRVLYRLSRWRTLRKFASYRRTQSVNWNRRRQQLTVEGALGAVFAPSALLYMREFLHRARKNPGVPFIGVSSEGRFFQAAVPRVSTQPLSNLFFEPTVNRSTLLGGLEASAKPQGQEPDAVTAPFVVDIRGQLALREARNERPLPTTAWPFSQIMRDDCSHAVLLDVGWMGTIQVMIRELAAMQNRQVNVSGMYLGRFARATRFGFPTGVREGVVFDDVTSESERPFFAPEIWEYILGNKTAYQELGPHSELQEGVYWALSDWKQNIRLSPADFVASTNPELKRVLWTPDSSSRSVLGSILWDVNTDDGVTFQPLIPRTRPSVPAKYANLVLHPRHSYREFVTPAPHVWLAGYARALRIGWFFRLSLWLARRIGHLDARDF